MKKSRILFLSSILLALSLIIVTFESCNDSYDIDDKTNYDTQNSDSETAGNDVLVEASYGNFSTTQRTVSSADREKQIKNSELDYATGSAYSAEQIKSINSAANKIKNWAIIVFPNAKKMMEHYLDGSGDTYNIDMESFFSDETALKNRNEDLNNALRAAENLAVAGKKINIYQVEESIYHNLSGDWKYSVGSYFSSVELYDVTVSNGVYTAKLKYIINDFYNWDPNDSGNLFSGAVAKIVGDVSPRDLHQLHLNGTAKEFLSHGEITYRVTWVEGQDISNIKLN